MPMTIIPTRNPAPIPNPSQNEGVRGCLLANISRRMVMMAKATMSFTNMPTWA